MGRISRYVMMELIAVFLVALTGLTALIVVALLANEAVRQGLGPGPILRLLPFALPQAMPFAIPATILFAACSVYGRMSSMNEVVAIKSLGVSPMSILWPGFILAFIVSLAAVWLNDLAASWGRTGMQRVIIQSLEQVAYGTLRTHRSYSAGKLSIHVKGVDDRKLIRPTITILGGGDSNSVTITAAEAELHTHPERETLTLVLTNGTIEIGEKMRMVFPGTIEREIPLSDASKAARSVGSPANVAVRDIPEEAQKQRGEITKQEEQLAAEAGIQLLTGDFAALGDEAWRARQSQLLASNARLSRLYVEPWRRWANGFCCFFFVFIGAPLAIHLRTADLWTTFGLCFLPILILYYPLMMFGVDRAKAGALPPFTVWTGNLVLLGIGFLILRKVMRY